MPSNNDDGPWGRNTNPPDIDDVIRQAGERIKQAFSGGGPRGVIILGAIVLAGIGLWTAYYTVPSDSVAVVQRFGKYLKEVQPGLHFKLPLGVDLATIVPVKRQLEAGVRIHHTGSDRSVSESERR